MHNTLKLLSEILNQADFTLPEVILWLLNTQVNHPLKQQLFNASGGLIQALKNRKHPHSPAGDTGHECVNETSVSMYIAEVKRLTDVDNGWHFNSIDTTPEQLEDFHLEDMEHSMHSLAPSLWHLWDCLLSGKLKRVKPDLSDLGGSSDTEEELGQQDLGDTQLTLSKRSERKRLIKRQNAILSIVSLELIAH